MRRWAMRMLRYLRRSPCIRSHVWLLRQTRFGPTSLAFVSQASRERVGEYGLAKEVVSVEHCRDIGKADMRLNDVVPNIEVDPETYKVNVDGEEITCEPAEKLPLAQLYHLF